MASRGLLFISCCLCILLRICSLQGVKCDVPDGFVYTDLQKTAAKGDELVLKCQFYRAPIAVYWKKGTEPTESPNLITWVEGESASGSCVYDRSCNIIEDYSLVIKSIRVSDQGSYICRVSNYNGILIHNFTEVNVYAPPAEPFPVIDECPAGSAGNVSQTCSLSGSRETLITCTASNYFPDIDLFFLHESKQMKITDINEKSNVDGTKNKSVSILAEPSENPYVCVASGIPGSQGQRTASVTVRLIEVTTTATKTTAPSNQTISPLSRDVAKIVVPVLVIVLLVAVVVFVLICWRKKKRHSKDGKSDPESMPLHQKREIHGKVSFFEMWHLVPDISEDILKGLMTDLVDLRIREDEKLPKEKAYELLCQWKDTNKYNDEAMRLKEKLSGHRLEESWKHLCEFRYDSSSTVSEELLDHILWEINDGPTIHLFLRELIKHEALPKVLGNKREAITSSKVVLEKWRNREHGKNQVVQLSLALEKAKCKPLDRTFFKVPDHLIKAISPGEIEGFVYRLTERHCIRLGRAMGIKEKEIAAVVNENSGGLKLTQTLIKEWLDRQECCNFQKRCRLDDAIIKIGRYDMTDSFETTSFRVNTGDNHERPNHDARAFNSSSIFDDDIAFLLKYLPKGAIPLLLEKLGITLDDKEIDLQEMLQCWRDQNMKEAERCSLQDLAAIYNETLDETKDSYGIALSDDDLENIIATMTSTKQAEELASKLGIESKESPLQTLKAWRDGSATKQQRETLEKALESVELSGCMVNKLPPMYVYQVELERLAWIIFSRDVWPLMKFLDIDIMEWKPALKGTVSLLTKIYNKSEGLWKHRRQDFCLAIRKLGYPEVARSAFFGYDSSLSELCNMTSELSGGEVEKLVENLELGEDVLSACQQTTGSYDTVVLMKIWKDRHRAESINFRVKLALGLRAAGKGEIANRILAGDYWCTNEVSSKVVESIWSSMDGDRQEKLPKQLQLEAGNSHNASTATLLTEWITNWLSGSDESSIFGVIKEQLTDEFEEIKSRGKTIDNLYTAGFYRLAEELMLLEISRLRPVKRSSKGLGGSSCSSVNNTFAGVPSNEDCRDASCSDISDRDLNSKDDEQESVAGEFGNQAAEDSQGISVNKGNEQSMETPAHQQSDSES